MSSSLKGQNLFFSDRGLKNLKLGELIYEIEKTYSFEMVDKNVAILTKYSFAFMDSVNYYYLKSNPIPSLFDSSTTIEDLFIATNKKNEIIGIIIFSSLLNQDVFFRNLNTVYGNQKLILNSDIENLKRQKNFWANDYSSVFLTTSNSTKSLRLSIERKKVSQDDSSPFISRRY